MRLESFEFTTLTAVIFVKILCSKCSKCQTISMHMQLHDLCAFSKTTIEMISGSEVFYESSNLMNL